MSTLVAGAEAQPLNGSDNSAPVGLHTIQEGQHLQGPIRVLTLEGEKEPARVWELAYLYAFAEWLNEEKGADVYIAELNTDRVSGSWLAPRDEAVIVDIVATHLSITDQRQEAIANFASFSTPHMSISRSLEVRNDYELKDRLHELKDIESLSPKLRVAVVTGTMSEASAPALKRHGAVTVAYSTFDEAAAALEAGEVDAFSHGFHHRLQHPEITDYSTVQVVWEEKDDPEQAAFVVRKDSDGLLEALNEFVQAIDFQSWVENNVSNYMDVE